MVLPFSQDNPATQELIVPVVSIQEGPVLEDNIVTNKIIESDSPSIFVDYEVRNHYERDGHIYMAGLTSPTPFQGNSVAFFQLAAPTLLWIADWTAARFFQQPPIPDPNSVGDNWILLDGHFTLADIKPGPDSETPFYRITGTYIYGCKNPSSEITRELEFGRPAYLNADTFPRTISLEALQPGIINNVQSVLRTTNFNIPV